MKGRQMVLPDDCATAMRNVMRALTTHGIVTATDEEKQKFAEIWLRLDRFLGGAKP